MCKCWHCQQYTARVRKSECEVALISGRAHVDCEHHSEYRYVIKKEIMESMEMDKEDDDV